jgi:hypothetical protein
MRRDAPLGDPHGAAQGQCRQSTRHRNRDRLDKGIVCSSNPAVSEHLSRDAGGRRAVYTPRTSGIGSRRSCSRLPREPRRSPGGAGPLSRGQASSPAKHGAGVCLGLPDPRRDSPLAWLPPACSLTSVARRSGCRSRPRQEAPTPVTVSTAELAFHPCRLPPKFPTRRQRRACRFYRTCPGKTTRPPAL